MHRRTLCLALIWAVTAVRMAAAEPVARGIDHIPVAVMQLERATASFEALGFALKPGRPHKNGLRNAHVKFADGTEIELITAPAATDALASQYYAWLQGGEGPAFLGLYAPDFDALAGRLAQFGLPLERKGGLGTLSAPPALSRLFFGRRQHSPTDRPEYFAHANTALGLSRVWIAGGDAERQLLPKLGAMPIEEPPCGPFGAGSAAFSLPEAEIVFLPETTQLIHGRSLVAATVAVKSLEAARNVLKAKGVPYERPNTCAGDSLWIDPSSSHGMWLEFRQPPSR